MSTKQVVVIETDGSVKVDQMPAGGSAEYQYLNTAVAGWIQCVDLDEALEGVTIWVNEEGKMEGLPYNALATLVWETSYGFTDVIVGNAVLTGGTDDDGETLGLTDEQVAKILALVK